MANCLKILLVFLQGWGGPKLCTCSSKHMVMICIAWLYFPRGASGMFHSYQPPTSNFLQLSSLEVYVYIWVPARCAHFSDFFKMWIAVLKLFLHLFFPLFKDQESEDLGSKKDPGKWSSRLLSGNYGTICVVDKVLVAFSLSCLSVDHQSGWYDGRL
jgi:hypothetical protein